MMGFGTVVAAMVSVAIILLTSYVCSNGGFYMAEGIADSVTKMQENENEKLKTGIEITGIHTDETNIFVSLHNTGSTKIGDFDHMDVIVNYSNTSGNAKTIWIPYQEDAGTLENRWIVKNIRPDLVNPGIIDPGEEMELQILLEDSLENESVNWLLVAAPNGAKASGYFNA
jgi:archaeal flagellar protein FlaF